MQRRPTDIAAAFMPGNPGRRPLRLRHPIPAELRTQIPAAVIIRGPAPRLFTGPIPASFRALPVTIAVRTPVRLDATRNPAAAITADDFPSPVLSEGLIEVALSANLHDWTHHDDSLHAWLRTRLHINGWFHINRARSNRFIDYTPWWFLNIGRASRQDA